MTKMAGYCVLVIRNLTVTTREYQLTTTFPEPIIHLQHKTYPLVEQPTFPRAVRGFAVRLKENADFRADYFQVRGYQNMQIPRTYKRGRESTLYKMLLSATGGNRTPNLLVRSQVLCPLSYSRLIVRLPAGSLS